MLLTVHTSPVGLEVQGKRFHRALVVLAQPFPLLPAHLLEESHPYPALDGGSPDKLVL